VHKDVGGSQPFEKLAKFALKILSLPLSNAVVERAFSVMNATETKPRNKMNFMMLDAILRIRTHFHARKICCVTSRNKIFISYLNTQKLPL